MRTEFPTIRIPVIVLAALAASAAVPAMAEDRADRNDYAEAMAAGLYAEAESAAKQALDRALAAGARDDPATANLFVDLAEAQRRGGNYDAARQNFELAIDIVEARTDRLNLALIEPLRGLAETWLDSARPDLAIEPLERALHVRHVNEGPHSIAQDASLEILARAYRQLGDFEAALDVVERRYLVFARAYPGKSPELVPVLLERGRALGDLERRRDEREAYEQAVKIVRANAGKKSAAMIEPLLCLGRSHQDEYFLAFLAATSEEELPDDRLLRQAGEYFESALDIAGNLEPEEHWETIADAHLAFADFHTLSDELGPAGIHYREAWRLLTRNDETHERRVREFETRVPLLEVLPDLTVALPFNADPETRLPRYDTGVIVMQFTITPRGRTRDVGLVDISPARNAAIETEVSASLKRSVYRPRYEKGFAADAPGQTVRYEFPVPKSAATGE